MTEGVVDVRVSKKDDFIRMKKLADEAYENKVWLDASKYYTQLVEMYDGDYEVNFRSYAVKIHIWGNLFNKHPHVGKSIESALNAFNEYKIQLMKDESIPQQKKEQIITTFFTDVRNSIMWIYNKEYDSFSRGLQTNIKEVFSTLGYCLTLFLKLANTIDHFLDDCFFLSSTFESILEKSEKITWWHDSLSKNFNFRESADAIAFKNNKSIYKSNILNAQERAKQIQKEALLAYWEAHPEEKQKLESEKQNLLDQITSTKNALDLKTKDIQLKFNEKKTTVSDELSQKNIECQDIKQAITKLNMEKETLGIFKIKEKKQIDEKITSLLSEQDHMNNSIRLLNNKLDNLSKEEREQIDRAKKETQTNLDALQRRIDAINVQIEGQ